MSRVEFARFVKDRLASLVSFDNTGTDLSSDNVQDAIVELDSNPWGKDFGQASKAVDETTTGNSFSVYDTLDFTVSENTGSNKYRINCNFAWGHNSAANDIRVQVLLDGVLLKELRMEPKDAGTDQRIFSDILNYAENLSQGSHTITLQYRPASQNRVSRMYNSEIEVWRVS